MSTKENIICTIDNIPMYWQSADTLSESEKYEYNLHEDKSLSFEGIVVFMDSVAAVYSDDAGQQYYFYLDDIEGSDDKGYGCGTHNFFWQAEIAAVISRLKGQKIDESAIKFVDIN